MKSARLKPVAAEEEAPAPERRDPWSPWQMDGGTWPRHDGSVDSVQWVDLPGAGELDLAWLEPAYFAWVPIVSADFVQPRTAADASMSLGVEPFHWPRAIRLAPPRIEDGARTRAILGGMLAEEGGSIGFERVLHPEGPRLIVAVRGLRPRMPPFLYFRVQAQLHERSTFGFLRQIRDGWRRRLHAQNQSDAVG